MKTTDFSLEEYIKNNKKTNKASKGKSRAIIGRIRRISKISRDEKKPHKKNKSPLKIIVQNLPESVQNDELFQIFSKTGNLLRCNVLFDKLGKSKVDLKENGYNLL